MFFRENPSIFVYNNKEAISAKRPARYVEMEQDLVQRTAEQTVEKMVDKMVEAEEVKGTVEQMERV